jgi:tetratricopeptide (TPR) repeat protein
MGKDLPAREWFNRIATAIFVPTLILALLEGLLCFLGAGYPPDFLIPVRGHPAHTTNHQFGWRFFPPAIARTPIHLYLPDEKSPTTCRVFVIGSSAAMGFPDPAYSFARHLETMLRHQYPNARFEIVNAGMTGINSHAALPIVRSCAGCKPDLFIVYLGNNELIGPFGPQTVFDRYSPDLHLIRFALWIRSTRIGQTLDDLIRSTRSAERPPAEWGGMEMFLSSRLRASDPRLPVANSHFEQNLMDICAIARHSDAPVILCTLANNLREMPPFASLHRPDLSAPDLSRWEELLKQGIQSDKKGCAAEALDFFRKADDMDPEYAELHYRMARCCEALKRAADADRHYRLARDLDTLHFRANSSLNEVIRKVGNRLKDRGVLLLDIETQFAAAEQNARIIPDETLFYEHVHFTFKGNHLLATALLDRINEVLPSTIRTMRDPKARPLSMEECAAEMAFTPWDRYRLASYVCEMLQHPPFTMQMDHEVHLANWQHATREMERSLQAQGLEPSVAMYRRAIASRPDDWLLRHNFITLQETRGMSAEAQEQHREIRRLLPSTAIGFNAVH